MTAPPVGRAGRRPGRDTPRLADLGRHRLLAREAVVVGGPEGVRRFATMGCAGWGALPAAVKLVIFGPGAVQGHVGGEHRHRKAMFLEVLIPEFVAALGRYAEAE